MTVIEDRGQRSHHHKPDDAIPDTQPQINRDHYREPTRKPAAAGAAGGVSAAAAAAEQLTSEVAAKDDFWAALDVMLGQSLGENDAARVRRAFAKVGRWMGGWICGMVLGSWGVAGSLPVCCG